MHELLFCSLAVLWMMLESAKRFTELDSVFAGLSSGLGDDTFRIRGIVVEVGADSATIAAPSNLPCFSAEARTDVAETSIGFLNVPIASLSQGKPKGWTAISSLSPWPDKNAVMVAYNSLMEEPVAAPSSTEVEQLYVSAEGSRSSLRPARDRSSQAASSAEPAAVARMPAALLGLLRGSQGLVGGEGLDEDGSDEGELLDPLMRPMMASSVAHASLPPGVNGFGSQGAVAPAPAATDPMMVGDLVMFRGAYESGQLPLKNT